MAPKLWDLLYESNGIINSQPRHYLTLSLIFLLPLSLISQLMLKHLQQNPPTITNPTTIFFLSLFLFLISSILSYGAFITITYSVYNAFFNQPVKLKEAIKSISTSFFPLLATSAITFTIYFFISFLFMFLNGLVLFFIFFILGHIDLMTNPSFLLIYFMVSMILIVPLVIYLEVYITLVKVIVVVESCWGLEPLKRSWKLVKGVKWLAFSTIFLFGTLQMILVWISGYSWVLIFVVSPILVVLLLYYIAVCTLLYIYCKEKQGELAVEEFGKEKDEANLSLIPL